MAQALRHLQQLSTPASARGRRSSSSAAATASSASSERLYNLLAALEGTMDAVAYLSALRELASGDASADGPLRRRALRLFAGRVERLDADIEDADLLPAALGDKGAADARVRALSRASMAICDLLPELLGGVVGQQGEGAAPGGVSSAPSSSPLTRQAALLAADAAIRRFGGRDHQAVMRCAPAIVAAARDASAPAAVRGGALACLASAASAAKQRWLPLLPGSAAAVLGAAADARAALADLAGPQARALVAAEEADEEEEGAAEEGEDNNSSSSPAVLAAALLLAGALAALQSMYGALGAFMSPYVPDTLALLTDPVVLAAAAAGGNGNKPATASAVSLANVPGAAARLRAALPAAVPPRLLLDPLVDHWDSAVAACGGGGGSSAAAPAVALLAIAREAAALMDARAAAAHHDALFDLVLRALDTRQRWLLELAGGAPEVVAGGGAGASGRSTVPPTQPLSARLSDADVHAVEQAAVQTLLAVVMKLSEARFKPLFLRLVEWASAAATAAAAAAAGASGSGRADRDRAATAAVGGLGRSVALLSAVVGLSGRLRGVFTPYYRHVLDLAVAQLQAAAGGEWGAVSAGGQQPPKKKQRQLQAAAAAAAASAAAVGGAKGGEHGAADALALAAWLARNRSVRALHLLFLHDAAASAGGAGGGGFVDAARLDALLPPLAAQLRADPPSALRARLAEQDAARELDAPALAPCAGGERARRAEAVIAASGHGSPLSDLSGGLAVVAALAQMAASAPQAAREACWRQINRAALMGTRRDGGGGGAGPIGARCRLRAAAVVLQLVSRLREEYLSFLPEALPYVAELLEDPDAAVAAAGQALAAALEEASGEALDEHLKG
jgi:U3 small nucleolar RNA-associated protein 10